MTNFVYGKYAYFNPSALSSIPSISYGPSVARRENNMAIPQELIYKILDQDRATALTLALLSVCVEKMDPAKVTPEEIVRMESIFTPVAKKLADQIENGISKNAAKTNLTPLFHPLVSGTSKSKTTNSFLRNTPKG